METATLTSPPRPLMVQPIQKSLSLPSYARASGEGIDHKIIFAALEQREKVRRKSKIFKDKEKCGATRQNYFCLPLPSNAKCRETSLSSDTSCSSLEFQKPKCRSSPTKLRNLENERKSLQNGVHDSEKMTPSPTLIKSDVALNEINDKGDSKKESLSPVRMDVSRSTIGSSDSMERAEKSSKSSNDSLSRRERLVAIKARVEAEREKKLCGSSSDDDDVDLRITRHNSDGVIHRTVREVKSKSSKNEKRLRRKTQDDMAMRRTLRKLHTSLYLPSTTDFDVWKPPILRTGSSYSLQRDLDEFSKEFLSADHKTDCNPAFYSNSVSNHNYFSDICNGSFRSRLNKSKVEETESTQLNKQKINALRREKIKHDISFPDNNNNFTEHQDNQKKFSYKRRDIQYDGSHFGQHEAEEPSRKCPSPICRAPTPPPRSPKSIEFVNKAFFQHQNATNFFQDSRSLERKKTFCRPNLTHCVNSEDMQYQKSCNSPKTPESPDIAFFDRRNKDMISSRRRTLCNFPQIDDMETNQRPKTPTNIYRNKFLAQNFPPRSPDLSHKLGDSNRKTKGYASGPDVSVSKLVLQHELPAKKWEKMELDSEKKFNSLENKSKTNMSAWLKDRWLLGQRNSCSCDDPRDCICGHGVRRCFKADKKYSDVFQINPVQDIKTKINATAEISNKISKSMPTSKTPPIPSDRLSKSEANLAKRSPPKTPSPKLRNKPFYSPKNNSKNDDEMLFFSGQNASQNLDTAMEELENVYRSLRVSNENLSAITSDQTENLNNCKEFALRHPTKSSSSFRNRTTGSVRNSLNELLIKERAQVNINASNPNISVLKAAVSDNEKNSLVREALGIEELFSDLTQQLDLEQQLLQETKNRKATNKPQGQQTDCSSTTQETSKSLETPSTVPDSPKPIYEANQNKLSLGNEFGTSEAHFDMKERLLALRKREIVGSLSSNIAYLMKSNENKKETPEHFILNRNQSSPRCCAEGEEKSLGKHVAKETTSLCQKSEDTDKIWQVRVSMSSGNMRAENSVTSPQNDRLPSAYSRLRSAVKLPRTDNSRDSSPCPSSFNYREKGNDSNELEKMLSNLLSEVPQTKGLPSQSESELAETQHEKTKKTLKDVSRCVGLQKYYFLNMDNSIASKERIKNEKKNSESNPHPPDSFSKEKMDNDSLCNNNYSSQTQRLSFIPVRSRSNLQEKYTLPKNKSCDDNRAVTSHRALAGNLSYPASPYRSGIRRHSLGIDDLSNDLSIHVNSNQGSRFQSLGRRTTTSSTNSSVSFNFTSFEQIANGRSTYEEHLLTQKPNQNEKFADQSPNTRGPRQFNPVPLEPAQFSEKVKDKSFVRKSSLNRIEFVNSAHQLNDAMPHTSFIFTPEQHSTSEANSDHQQQSQVEGSSILLAKKRNNSFRANRKEILGRQTKQDFPGLTIRKEESMVPLPLHPKTQENIAWWRNKKASLKKKSYSAGEQDSMTDNPETWKRESYCFSAQEIDSQDYMLKQVNKKVTSDQPKKTLQSPPLLPCEKTLVHTEVSGDAKSMLKDQRSTCDNTSQTSAAEVFGACHGTSVSQDVPSEKNGSQRDIFNSDDDNNVLQKNSNSDNINPLPEDEPLDGDLFISSTSPVLKNSSLPFPINNIETESSVTLAATPKNNEDNENISDPLVDTDDNITKVSSEISSLDISTDSLETNTKDITEDDSSRQPNSILRRKSPDDRKGIQGILKYAGDEKLAWQPPSILKHRESSEEKDNWSQPDLHSILKKSASEDESCNGNTDIRPILKNASTDDESSSFGSKPKPILKKRTSFSEECSYACFSSGELKPILKKKTINEICEDQPKPILKTRRKSEEATASISEFPLGTRPRAYSADRGVKMCNEKKSLDDDFT